MIGWKTGLVQQEQVMFTARMGAFVLRAPLIASSAVGVVGEHSVAGANDHHYSFGLFSRLLPYRTMVRADSRIGTRFVGFPVVSSLLKRFAITLHDAACYYSGIVSGKVLVGRY